VILLDRRRLLLGLVALLWAHEGEGREAQRADRVIVLKADRQLQLWSGGDFLRSFSIRLGRNPKGPKIFQFDGRTPEGVFVIDRRTTKTGYHRALHISYPDAENLARAARYGLPAGGGIFIHGTPGSGGVFDGDWTDGCIAVSNEAIDEIWALVSDGTTIEIRP
jgi:murein L,D-transpeptidase YafK